MDRVLKNTPATLSEGFYEDGVISDPGTVTVTVTRADGTVVATGAATGGIGAAARTYTLSTVVTATLDTLTISWVSSGLGTLTSTVEVVGGFLFTIAEARAITPLDNVTDYSTADIAAIRITVEQAIEQACGCAFVPRYSLERYSGDGSQSLQLKHPLPSSVRSATIAGSALTSPQLADLTLSASGELWSSMVWWAWGRSNIQVGYEHGYGDPPAEIRRAALQLAKEWLVGRSSPLDERATTFSATDGGTYGLVVAGRGGSEFGLPDVDAAVARYSLRADVA